jgi:hypothetical protein
MSDLRKRMITRLQVENPVDEYARLLIADLRAALRADSRRWCDRAMLMTGIMTTWPKR